MFISHANPEDNEFARWLTLKLAAVGYRAWSDVTRLFGGEDFWCDIERVIREEAVKFLYVLSRTSNEKEGALRELRVADATRKKYGFTDFVIPLRIDDLPHGDMNIELARLNAVVFSAGWAVGLKQLLEKLEGHAVPRDDRFNHDAVRQWWENAFNVDLGVSVADERHMSNWFGITLPDHIYIHTLLGLFVHEPSWSFPTTTFHNGILTFAPASDLATGLGTLQVGNTVAIPTKTFLSEGTRDEQRQNRNAVTYLLSRAWELFGQSRGLSAFKMANGRLAFYFDKRTLPDPDVKFTGVDGRPSRRQLMGFRTKGNRHWHFAVSAKPAVHPEPMLTMRAHVLFSNDGVTLWTSDDAMHKARRSQCRQWWNDDWRDRLLATMTWLSEAASSIALPLGTSVFGIMPIQPLDFASPVTLNEAAREVIEPEDGEVADEDEDDIETDDEGEPA